MQYLENPVTQNCIWNLLKYKLVTCSEILSKISQETPCKFNYALFSTVLSFCTPEDLYLRDTHFLHDAHSMYKMIYVLKGGNLFVTVKKNSSETLYSVLGSAFQKYFISSVFRERVHFFASLPEYRNTFTYSPNITYALMCREENTVDAAWDSDDIENSNYLEVDWVAKIQLIYNVNETLTHVRSRITVLQDEVPEYWKCVSPEYVNLFRKLLKSGTAQRLDVENISFVSQIDPDFLPPMCDTAYKIAALPYHTRMYVLGFPVDACELDVATVFAVLKNMPAGKEEEYIREISQRHIKTPVEDTVFSTANYQDSLCENVNDYLSFDTLQYYKNNKIYVFTRPEFSHLISTCQNPLTRESIPLPTLQKMYSKTFCAQQQKLPICRTIPETLNAIAEGRLYEVE